MLKICRQLVTNQQFEEAVPLIATTAKHSPVTSVSLVLVLVLRIVDVCRCHHFANDRYFLRVKKKIFVLGNLRSNFVLCGAGFTMAECVTL